MSHEKRSAIIGGGAVGLTAAYDLARRGENVTLFERGSIGSGSTGRAAGVLYDAYAEDRDAEIGQRTIERFRAFSGKSGFQFHETPYVWFAHKGDEKRASAIRKQVSRMQTHGIDAELLECEELAALTPTLETDDVSVAAIAQNAGWTEPATYAELMAEKSGDEGVEIRTATPVSLSDGGVRVGDRTELFEAVIVAAGAHTKRIVESADYDLAMKPYRVQALVLDTEVETPMGYDATEGFYFRPHPEGLLVGDGTEEGESDPDEWDREADEEFVESALERVGERFKTAESTVERAWAGLCTATPDGDPLLGWLSDDVFVATGFQGHGFMRAPAFGERIAAEVRDKEYSEFDPKRFSGDEEFSITEGMAIE
jgi:sarcosine oxidase subunit beta